MSATPAKPILVAVDGSPSSWEALETALSLAKLMDRPVEVLHVVQLRKAGYFAFIDRHLKEDHEAQAQKILQEAEERGRQAGVPVRTHLLETEKSPAEAIVEYLSGAGPIKFLVMGTHGHGYVARHLLGSVTERVLRDVTHRGLPVPLLIVPGGTGPE
ncbi:MAG: universal stress protein [Syntrophobacterales bacterium]|nr:universal stress protein [Syntrophobacterales bacterium]